MNENKRTELIVILCITILLVIYLIGYYDGENETKLTTGEQNGITTNTR